MGVKGCGWLTLPTFPLPIQKELKRGGQCVQKWVNYRLN